jgi:hypothetical protein
MSEHEPSVPSIPYSATSAHVELPAPIPTLPLVVSADEPQPTMTPEEISAAARAIRADIAARATPTMSEPEFAAWYQAFLVANSALALDPRTSTTTRGKLAEMQADEGLAVWRSKRMKEGLPV